MTAGDCPRPFPRNPKPQHITHHLRRNGVFANTTGMPTPTSYRIILEKFTDETLFEEVMREWGFRLTGGPRRYTAMEIP